MNDQPTQLSFSVFLREQSTFDNFVAEGDVASMVVHSLKELAVQNESDNILLWGARGCGLSHLLQATCHRASLLLKQAQYLPLADLIELPPDQVLADLSHMDILCVDDVHLCAGKKDWESALFHLYNDLKASRGRLVCAMHQSPSELDIVLPDLRSRLLSAPAFQMPSLSDEGKVDALIIRADNALMELPVDVANYLINRVSRSTEDLFTALSHLEQATITQQRKLTIPFVKQELNLP